MPRNRTAVRRAAIYARVSTTNGQTPENQLRELREVAGKAGGAGAVLAGGRSSEAFHSS